MKKRVLVWLLAMTTATSLLSGCGGAAKEAEREEVVEETPEEEVVEELEPECAHEWVEATFSAPKTCSICGETEGERKLSYFEERGVEVPDGPAAGTVNAVLYNVDNPEQNQKPTDVTWEQLSCRREPAEGYDLITLELRVAMQAFYDGAQEVEYSVLVDVGSYDWYTGRKFPIRDMVGDGAQDYSTVVEVDGKSYDVSSSLDVRWEREGWGEPDAEGNCHDQIYGYITYKYKVPEGYDGLVVGAIAKNEYDLDTETVQGTDEAPIYAFDEGEYQEGTLFFRINREGGMTIEEVQPSGADEQPETE